MARRPKVSVILPVYNATAFLRDALDSVLAQSYSDFEVLAIDDGSVDGSADILDSYRDPRLRVLRHESNLGLVTTLNDGLAQARGDFAARMDADDISLPDRFKSQVEFLEANPDVGICGTAARRFGADQRRMTVPTDAATIRCELLFKSPLIHPSVMMRLHALRSHELVYRESHHPDGRRSGEITTDFDLWRRASDCFPMANIAKILLRYRVHAGSVTVAASKQGDAASAMHNLDRDAISRLGLAPSDAEVALHFLMRTTGRAPLDEFEQWLSKLKEANGRVNFYPRREFASAVARRWYFVCHAAPGIGWLKWRRMKASKLSEHMDLGAFEAVKFALRIR